MSPFALDPRSITVQTRLSASHYEGIWLRTCVTLRLARSREHALQLISSLSAFRHPNLEQFLGAVIDERSPRHLVVFDRVRGTSLADLLSANTPPPRRLALAAAVDVARALVYLHARTGRGFPGFCPHTVVFDAPRRRAVVLLMGSCPMTHGKDMRCLDCAVDGGHRTSLGERGKDGKRKSRPSRGADVYVLARMVVAMFAPHPRECLLSADATMLGVEHVPVEVREIVRRGVGMEHRARPKMAELCQALAELYDRCT